MPQAFSPSPAPVLSEVEGGGRQRSAAGGSAPMSRIARRCTESNQRRNESMSVIMAIVIIHRTLKGVASITYGCRSFQAAVCQNLHLKASLFFLYVGQLLQRLHQRLRPLLAQPLRLQGREQLRYQRRPRQG